MITLLWIIVRLSQQPLHVHKTCCDKNNNINKVGSGGIPYEATEVVIL
jgi:hypothetical protein